MQATGAACTGSPWAEIVRVDPVSLNNALIVLVIVAVGGLMLHPRVAGARLWQATITPLASIIGSGFLVIGPILDASFGVWAPVVMAVLCAGAYLFGSAIRFNIGHADDRGTTGDHLETAASWALAFAYVISVAYYLNLLGAFAVRLTTLDDAYHARLVTSGALLLILITGWSYGFRALERMEQVTVGIKLAIIAGLLSGLAWYFAERAGTGSLVTNPATVTGWPAVTLIFGLIVTVQGFETSRYLSADYDAPLRIRSMRLAQWLSTVIYLTYIVLLAYVFERGTLEFDETAIIGMMELVAPILPAFLVAAALSAQFSAAVADTSGSGGLLHELTGGRVSQRSGYAGLVVIGLVLTWTLNVFEIISYASRAFALYYALQAGIAAASALPRPEYRLRGAGYLLLAALGILIAVVGTPVESR